ncbi:hypothetical protein K2173_016023 [Erythroxylum novogranatense]|uniref:Uncharacterized protein n=1 Tax=Erythroxylum novogranatense TaxID=1862640 RepID=A0AAV8SF82_9ROSI|nr:hypothetical protein K2173_016023 [Erythroxylum novogranatense]
MGACVSTGASPESNVSKVVHLNGYVEVFDYPVTVREVTCKTPNHFVCTAAQLLTPGCKPLKAGAELEQGKIYFLVPHSTFETSTPTDLAATVGKLTAIAKSVKCVRANDQAVATPLSSVTPVWNSPGSSPKRREELGTILTAYGFDKSYGGGKNWKPLLDTINEKSFNRRTESQEVFDSLELPLDTHGVHLDTVKEDSVTVTVKFIKSEKLF